MGAPIGNQNGKKNRPWADVIKRALLANDGQKLRELAEKIIDRALEGDVSALKEIGDRVDGKVIQQLEHTGADGGDLIVRLLPADGEL